MYAWMTHVCRMTTMVFGLCDNRVKNYKFNVIHTYCFLVIIAQNMFNVEQEK